MNTNQNQHDEGEMQLPDTYCRNTLKFRHFTREAGVGLFIFMTAAMMAGCQSHREVSEAIEAQKDSVRVGEATQSFVLTDSILQEMTLQADSVLLTTQADNTQQIFAKSLKWESKSNRVVTMRDTIYLKDTINVHLRDSTHLARHTDSTGIYRPPELWLITFIILAVYFSFKLLVRS